VAEIFDFHGHLRSISEVSRERKRWGRERGERIKKGEEPERIRYNEIRAKRI